MITYTNRADAIYYEIIEPLGEHAADFDTDAIARKYLTTTGEGADYRYMPREDADFWAIVESYATR